MGYDLITVKNCQKIDSIINEALLSKEINIEIPGMNLTLTVDAIASIEESWELEGIGYDCMEKRCFMYQDSTRVLKIENRDYGLCFNLGSWGGYVPRIDHSHLVFDSTFSGFGNFFCQLEFSQALEDKDKIYIVKNISKLAGKGAIVRLNKGANSKADKYKRRDELVGRLDKKVIDYDGHKWICIETINKNDLKNEECHVDIFDGLMFNLLTFAFNIEDIISGNIRK